MDRTNAMIAAYSIVWEGCLSLSLAHHRRDNRVFPELIPSISIVGTSKELLDSFCSLIGYGKVRREKRKNPSTNQKEVHCWVVTGGMPKIKAFCEEIIPFLPAKRRQAELLIEYCSRKRFSRYDEKDYRIYAEMRELNRRGLSDVSGS